MRIQNWKLLGKAGGNFSLANGGILSRLSSPFHPAVKKFIIYPEFNFNHEQTGRWF